MNQQLLDSIIETQQVQQQELGLQQEMLREIKEMLKALPDYKESVGGMNNQLAQLQNTLLRLSFPTREIKELSKSLSDNAEARRLPMQVQHHHYIPKIAIVAGALLLLLMLTCTGWYSTSRKLKEYQAADTRYRYLKLEGDAAMQQILLKTDSLYGRNPTIMRLQVEQREEALQKRMELYQQAQEKESEARALRQKAAK